jgi:hypothetical protein
MANLQIYQLPAKPSVVSTDVFGVDDANVGHVTWSVTAAQIASFVNSSVTSSPPQIVYVANTGNDTTGTGTLASPYATITKALSVITTNSSTTPFLIYVIPGVYNETSLVIKPWVYIEGNNCTLNLTTSVSLDTGWTTAVGQSFIQNMTISLVPDAFNLNFTIGTGRASLLVLRNIITKSVPAIHVTGTSLETVILNSVYSFDGTTVPIIRDVNGNYGNSSFNTFTFTNTRTDNPLNFVLYDITTVGTVNIVSSGNQLTQFYMKSCVTQGTITANGIPTNLFLDGASTNVVPTLVGGAVLVRLGKSNNYDANYSPTNYTVADNSIRSQFVGIDNKLPSFLVKTNNLSDVSSVVTSAINLGLANGIQNFTANSDQNVTVPIPSTLIVSVASAGHFLLLPDATTLNPNEVGKKFYIRNIGSTTVGVKDFTGGVISFLAPNAEFFMIPTSNSNPAGPWTLTSTVSSWNGQVGAVTATSDNVAEGANRFYLSNDGGATTHQGPFNNFVNSSLTAGSNITLTQPGGPGTNTVITASGGAAATAQTLMVMISPQLNFPNGFTTSVVSTMQGTNLIPANTLVPGDLLQMTITGLKQGTVSGGSMIMLALFGAPVGHIVGQSPSISSNLGGATSVRPWNLTFQITIISSTQYTASAVGYYADDGFNIKSFQMNTNPVILPFDPTIVNLMDVAEIVTVGSGSTFGFYAYNLSIIKYHV